MLIVMVEMALLQSSKENRKRWPAVSYFLLLKWEKKASEAHTRAQDILVNLIEIVRIWWNKRTTKWIQKVETARRNYHHLTPGQWQLYLFYDMSIRNDAQLALNTYKIAFFHLLGIGIVFYVILMFIHDSRLFNGLNRSYLKRQTHERTNKHKPIKTLYFSSICLFIFIFIFRLFI